VIGGWSRPAHFKYQPPTPGKRMRKLMRQSGYIVLLCDEYHTSKRCSWCQDNEGETLPFKRVPNPRPWKRGQMMLRHGLVRCSRCNIHWDRDYNSAINMYRIGKAFLFGKPRPKYLRRPVAAIVQNNNDPDVIDLDNV